MLPASLPDYHWRTERRIDNHLLSDGHSSQLYLLLCQRRTHLAGRTHYGMALHGEDSDSHVCHLLLHGYYAELHHDHRSRRKGTAYPHHRRPEVHGLRNRWHHGRTGSGHRVHGRRKHRGNRYHCQQYQQVPQYLAGTTAPLHRCDNHRRQLSAVPQP